MKFSRNDAVEFGERVCRARTGRRPADQPTAPTTHRLIQHPSRESHRRDAGSVLGFDNGNTGETSFNGGLHFRCLARGPVRSDLVRCQCRLWLKGSILELLVAVPTHVVARHRDYCCAGFLTFCGIVFGAAVMLLSSGPGVFFLFVERWKRLHPQIPKKAI